MDSLFGLFSSEEPPANQHPPPILPFLCVFFHRRSSQTNGVSIYSSGQYLTYILSHPPDHLVAQWTPPHPPIPGSHSFSDSRHADQNSSFPNYTFLFNHFCLDIHLLINDSFIASDAHWHTGTECANNQSAHKEFACTPISRLDDWNCHVGSIIPHSAVPKCPLSNDEKFNQSQLDFPPRTFCLCRITSQLNKNFKNILKRCSCCLLWTDEGRWQWGTDDSFSHWI